MTDHGDCNCEQAQRLQGAVSQLETRLAVSKRKRAELLGACRAAGGAPEALVQSTEEMTKVTTDDPGRESQDANRKRAEDAKRIAVQMDELECDEVLQVFLELAIPRWLERWKDKPWEQRAKRGETLGIALGEQAAPLVVACDEGGLTRRKGALGHSFNLLAESLALLLLANAENEVDGDDASFEFNGARWKL